MEERNCFVYEDIRMDNWSCCYVGMGSKNEETGYNRFEVAERNDHHDNIMNSYGIARVIIRDNLTRKEANALEEARIYYYVFALGYTIDIKGYIKGKKSDSHLTNQTWGGDGVKGHNPYANKTEEELEEWKKKIGEASKGRNHSEETRKKQSEAKKGEKAYWYGKKLSEETRKKQSEARKGKYKGENSPVARKVRCIETGEIFNTLTEASKWCGSYGSNIAKQIQGKTKSAGKHPVTKEKLHWEYADETIETINLNLLIDSNIKLNI